MQYVHAHTFNVFYMYFIHGTNDNKDIICEGFEHKPQIFFPSAMANSFQRDKTKPNNR